jgi:hypothetical protein
MARRSPTMRKALSTSSFICRSNQIPNWLQPRMSALGQKRTFDNPQLSLHQRDLCPFQNYFSGTAPESRLRLECD